ncbi:unnamed protein product [Rotaria sp. Silwood2]|nr:unnamed protein product [Rotaria sp. Silwood2]CAF4015499.1 unnamed protein product [Rotaria sp. Silwood2]CAF4116207.1 unnamed protein product [Rotaria sp. Silwood2]CAF4127101.1 unnamed protein product [Rotaria sp. Silwood2]
MHDCKIAYRYVSPNYENCSVCQLSHSHRNPYHSTNTHRIKYHLCQKKPIKYSKQKEKYREYKPGESCEYKGRTYSHPNICSNKTNCTASLYLYVKHSNDQWYPFIYNEYKLWLCDPSNIVNKCSFICLNSTHLNSIKDTQHIY